MHRSTNEPNNLANFSTFFVGTTCHNVDDFVKNLEQCGTFRVPQVSQMHSNGQSRNSRSCLCLDLANRLKPASDTDDLLSFLVPLSHYVSAKP